jgi:hypothetical protein
MEIKICTKCNNQYLLNSEYFYKDSCQKDGFSCRCKQCINEYKAKYNKTDQCKQNRKQIASYKRQCHKKNKKQYPLKQKQYAIKKKQSGYFKSERYKNNRKKIAHIEAMRKLIRRAILHKSYGKRTEQVLGYSYIKFKQRIETNFKDGMSWDNHGLWHVDHKKPVSLFKKGTPAKTINALCNLQPLWAKDNLKKSNKFNLTMTL